MKENYNGILEKYRPIFRSCQNITILKIRLRKILIARHLFTIALLFSTIIAHSQVSENFDKATLSSGSLNCWESTYDSQTFGSARVAAPTTQPFGMDSRLSLETTSPIAGSASLKVTESLVVPINKSAISTETLTSTAYGNDGDNVSFKVRVNSADITAYQALSVNIVCGNYYYSLPITTADIGNTITVSQTISGSGGGGIIKIELLYINDAFLNAVTTYSYSVDIDDFTTTANIDPDNNCANPPPVTISGQVWDDGNGDAVIGGVEATSPNDVTDDPAEKLTVYITDETGLVVGKADVLADGTYRIPGINPSATYTVTLSNDNTFEVGTSPVIPTVLPTNWANTGTNFPGTSANPNDGASGTVTVGTTDLADVNFGIEKKPVVTAETAVSTTNPGGTAQSPVIFPDGEGYSGTDLEDGTYPALLAGETVTLYPATGGTLYYDADGAGINPPVQVTTPTVFPDFNPAFVTIDPTVTGTTNVTFDYAVTDEAGVVSDPVTVTVPFTAVATVTLSGQVWDDGNGDAVIGGVEATSPNDVTDDPAEKLTVYITDETGLIVGKADVLADGTYSIPGINPSATYTVTLSNDNTLEVGTSPAIPTVLPTNWANTGINFPGTGANPNDGASGTVTVGSTDLADVNFGIEKKPVVTDQLADTTPNPSGNALAPVNFTLPSSGDGYAGSDLEDGTYPPLLDGETVSLTPGNNGDLYYDFDGPGENAPVQITAATTITNFDPANVYVDPAGINATSITITFTYAVVDNAGEWSDPATVTVPFDINLPVTLVKFSTEKLPSESGVSPKALVSWTTSRK